MQNGCDNKTIVKNTIILYIRQLLILGVTLYMSRVVLKVLGVTDYGIYNVVGGVVALCSFLTSTMASASQRFLSYELAKGDEVRLRETFSLIILSYIILAAITVTIIEAVAVWFLNTKMTIPTDRIVAANYVLQFSILTFVANILTTPYMSLLIAHEKMDAYAYISIADAILQLLVVYLLLMTSADKLIFYSILIFCSSFVINQIYRWYCLRRFKESHFSFFFDNRRLKEITSFAWWNMFGTLSNILRVHGVNILLNLFFGPVVNAARGIAYQVNSAVNTVSNNFYTAIKPQITKSCAAGNKERMKYLVNVSSRFAFYLQLFLCLPVYFNAHQILNLWLGQQPLYTTIFVKLILINTLLEVFSHPLVAGLQAENRIKVYQLTVSLIYLLNIPLSYILLKAGYPPEYTIIVSIFLVCCSILPRLMMCRRVYSLSVSQYIVNVLLRCFMILFLSYIFSSFVVKYLNADETVTGLIITVSLIYAILLLLIYTIGITKSERSYANNYISSQIKRRYGK